MRDILISVTIVVCCTQSAIQQIKKKRSFNDIVYVNRFVLCIDFIKEKISHITIDLNVLFHIKKNDADIVRISYMFVY